MAGLKVITPPAIEPVTVNEVKAQLRIELEDDSYDVILSPLITAAREWCESYQNRAYITQTLELALDRWPSGNEIELPRPPLQSVMSVKYIDYDDVEMWDTAKYIVDDYSFVARIVRARGVSWPSSDLPAVNGIKVQYVAGYTPGEPDGEGKIDLAANVPKRVKQAITLLVSHWFENPEAVLIGSISKEIEFSVTALLNVDRVVPL